MDIKVIKTVETVLSRNEREEYLAGLGLDVDSRALYALLDLEDEYMTRKTFAENSNIISILLRKLCQFENVIPIFSTNDKDQKIQLPFPKNGIPSETEFIVSGLEIIPGPTVFRDPNSFTERNLADKLVTGHYDTSDTYPLLYTSLKPSEGIAVNKADVLNSLLNRLVGLHEACPGIVHLLLQEMRDQRSWKSKEVIPVSISETLTKKTKKTKKKGGGGGPDKSSKSKGEKEALPSQLFLFLRDIDDFLIKPPPFSIDASSSSVVSVSDNVTPPRLAIFTITDDMQTFLTEVEKLAKCIVFARDSSAPHEELLLCGAQEAFDLFWYSRVSAAAKASVDKHYKHLLARLGVFGRVFAQNTALRARHLAIRAREALFNAASMAKYGEIVRDKKRREVVTKIVAAAGKGTSAKVTAIKCKHTVDEEKMRRENRSEEYIHNSLMVYASPLGIDSDRYHFCKLCGEQLTYVEGMRNNMTEVVRAESQNAANSELSEFVWKSVSFIVGTYARFHGERGRYYVVTFIRGITAVILPKVDEVEKQLMRIQTNSPEDVVAKKHLWTDVYASVMLIKIITENPREIYFAQDTPTGKASIATASTGKVLTRKMHAALCSSRNVLMRKCNVNEENLMEMMKRAFESISGMAETRLKHSTIASEFTMKYSGIARYYLLISGKSLTKDRSFSDYENSVDSRFAKIMLLASISSIVGRIPPFTPNILGKNVVGKDLISRSDYLFRTYIETGLAHKNPIVASVSKTDTGYAFVKDFSEDYSKFASELNAFRVEYNTQQLIRWSPGTRWTPGAFPTTNDEGFKLINQPYSLLSYKYGYEINKKPLKNAPESTRLKTATFHEHKWNLYRGGANGIFVTPAELSAGKGFEVFSDVIATVYCSKCLFSRDEIVSAMKDPLSAVIREQSIVGFYNYFTYKCPVTDDIHSMNDKRVCIKCGVTPDMIEKRDGKYYEKYLTKFNKRSLGVRVERRRAAVVAKITDVRPKKEKTKKGTESAPLSLDVEITKFMKSVYPLLTIQSKILKELKPIKTKAPEFLRIMENVGLIEGNLVEDIKSGKAHPAKGIDARAASVRLQHIRTHIHNVIVDINIILNKASLRRGISDKTIELLYGMKPKFDVLRFKTIDVLPISDVEKSSALYAFYLSQIVANVDSVPDFVRYAVGRMLDDELFTARAKDIKLAKLAAMKGIVRDNNAENDLDDRDSSLDGLAKEKNYFSYNAIDYDGSNDKK